MPIEEIPTHVSSRHRLSLHRWLHELQMLLPYRLHKVLQGILHILLLAASFLCWEMGSADGFRSKPGA